MTAAARRASASGGLLPPPPPEADARRAQSAPQPPPEKRTAWGQAKSKSVDQSDKLAFAPTSAAAASVGAARGGAPANQASAQSLAAVIVPFDQDPLARSPFGAAPQCRDALFALLFLTHLLTVAVLAVR